MSQQHYVGTTAYGVSDEPVEELTIGQQIHNPEYGVRMKHLNDVRYRTQTTSPCQERPQDWDAIDLEYSWKSGKLHVRQVDLERETERITRAVAGCRACPLLKDCEPLREVAVSNEGKTHLTLKVDAEGVIGGSLIDSTATAKYINQYLSTGSWDRNLRIHGDESTEG